MPDGAFVGKAGQRWLNHGTRGSRKVILPKLSSLSPLYRSFLFDLDPQLLPSLQDLPSNHRQLPTNHGADTIRITWVY